MAAKRRAYGEGSIYQRNSDGRWVATAEAGWTREGTRRRIIVTAKTRPEVVRKFNRKKADVEKYGDTEWDPRTTVKQWIDTYLDLRTKQPNALSPKGWKAAAQPLNRWVVGTIGHRRVADLTPGDIRKVDQAQYDATSIRGGKISESTVAATRRALMTCLRHAKAEGAPIRENVFLVAKPGAGKSDRTPLTLEHTLRCLAVAETLPYGLRWAFSLLYGARQGELLGLVEYDPLDGSPCVDFDAGVIRLAWQLQQLDYVDPKIKALGFKLPQDPNFEAVHLERRFHLIRPKSEAGHRELPMPDAVAAALRSWLDQRPANPWGLVFPDAMGRPCDDTKDREEWYAIQATATVERPDLAPVCHPSGQRYYYIHECRNFAATELDEAGASDLVTTALLGHTKIATSRRYQRATDDAKRAAVETMAARLGLMPPAGGS